MMSVVCPMDNPPPLRCHAGPVWTADRGLPIATEGCRWRTQVPMGSVSIRKWKDTFFWFLPCRRDTELGAPEAPSLTRLAVVPLGSCTRGPCHTAVVQTLGCGATVPFPPAARLWLGLSKSSCQRTLPSLHGQGADAGLPLPRRCCQCLLWAPPFLSRSNG